jgi:hypothetical protein
MKVQRVFRNLAFTGCLLALNAHAGIGLLTGDTYVNSANPGANFGSAVLMNVGGTNSALVQFDLSRAVSQLLNSPNVPSTVTPFIGRAVLTVYVNKTTVSGTLQAQPLTGAWSEGTVTAATIPAASPITASSGPISASAQLVQIDITKFVQGWLNNDNDPASPTFVGGGNFGMLLTSPDGGVFILDSKEATTTSHAPQLDIDLATDFDGTLRKTMTLAAPGFTSLMSVHLTGTNTAGGRIEYVVRATDGGFQIATEEGIIQWLATANSITCTVQTSDKLHLGTVNSGCTPGFFNPGSQPGISVFDNVSFSTPAAIVVHEVTFRIHNISGSVIRLEP